MNGKHIIFIMAATLLGAAACSSQHTLTGVERSRIVIDQRFDNASSDTEEQRFIAPYKHVVDSIISPIVGRSARYMAADRPESTLSNLLTDILLHSGGDYGEKPDFAVYNMGGIRAALAEGNVTYGDVVDMAPFENKIYFLTLGGRDVMELFQQIASSGGEGVSHGVQLVIDKRGNLLSAKINGSEVDENKDYRVATLDFLAQGNDGMLAFKKGRDVNAPASDENNVRFIIMKYLGSLMQKGIAADAKVEGRIIVNE